MSEDTIVYTCMRSPQGSIFLARNDAGLLRIHFQNGMSPYRPHDSWREDASPLRGTIDQLREYFDGERTGFDLPLAPAGTDFDRRVWTALRAIPFGETRTYGDIAREIGRPTASRAVGAANGRNPLPIVVPCHRVIGANGKLTGFAGGVEIKRELLEHERRVSPGSGQVAFGFS